MSFKPSDRAAATRAVRAARSSPMSVSDASIPSKPDSRTLRSAALGAILRPCRPHEERSTSRRMRCQPVTLERRGCRKWTEVRLDRVLQARAHLQDPKSMC